jgi:hypothetical protein
MQTDDLIDALTERLEPASPNAARRRLVLWVMSGAILSALIMLGTLGPRPDALAAAGTMMFWTKLAYTLALGGLCLWAAERLGRPGAKADRPALLALGVVVLFGLGAAARLATASPEQRHHLLMGHSAMICPWLILGLSLPILAAALAALRRLAPTRPGLAGLAAGLAAGGVGAFVYAFSCNETAMPFVAIWYTLPVALCGLIGAVAGRFALRW